MIPPLVVDTHVVVSGLITDDGDAPTARLLDAMLAGRVPFLLSEDLLAEYRAVLLRPKIAKLHGLDAELVDELLIQIAFQGAYRAGIQGADAAGDAHLFTLLEHEPRARLVSGDAAALRRAGSRGWSARECMDSLRGGKAGS